MNKKSLLTIMVVMLFCMTVLSGTLLAGRIAGNVIEKGTRLPLMGANVSIQGTSMGAATDRQGFFLIGAVPPGNYDVVVRYMGYREQTQNVQVTLDGTTNVEFVMESSVLEVGGVTVTAERNLQSQAAALNAQYEASNIKNVVSADLMGTFPDEEAVDAIGRIPGVMVDGGEAIMRGMPAEWSLVTLNGEKIPSVNAAVDRSDPLETFPIDLIQAIEVSKGQTADMDADAIAGNINFILKDAPNRRILSAKAQLGVTQNYTKDYKIEQIDFFGPMKVSLNLGDAYADGKFGYMISGTWEKETSSNRAERWSYDFSDNYWPRYQASADKDGNTTAPGLRYYRDSPTESAYFRGGFNTALMYKPALGHKFMLKTYYSFYNLTDYDLELTDRYTYHRGTKFYDGYTSKLNDVKHEPKSVINVAFGGEHLLGDVNLDYAIHYTSGRGGENHDVQVLYETLGYEDIAAGNDTMYFAEQNFENEIFKEDDIILATNVKKPFGFGNIFGYAKAGLKYKTKDRYQQKLDSNVEPIDAEDLADAEGFKYWISFMDDDYISEWDPPTDLLLNTDSGSDMWENYLASETIMAAYVMTEIWLGKNIMVLPGLRVEKTTTEAEPRLIDTFLKNNPEAETEQSAVKASGTYTDLFPSVNLRFKLPYDVNFRISGSKGISRPSFRLFVGYNDYDPNNLELRAGNPDLVPTRATNLDFILEHYSPNMASHISAGYFMKDIKDVMQLMYYTYPEEENHLFNGYHVTEVEIMENVGTGHASGIELSVQQQLDFLGLPEVGILANWTHQLDTYLKDAITGEKMQLPRQAEDVINAALSFELAKIGFSSRLSFQYKSKVFQGLLVFGEEWRDPQKRLDLVLRQRITKNVRVFFNGRNLLGDHSIRKYIGMRPEFTSPLEVIYNKSYESREFYGGFEFNL